MAIWTKSGMTRECQGNILRKRASPIRMTAPHERCGQPDLCACNCHTPKGNGRVNIIREYDDANDVARVECAGCTNHIKLVLSKAGWHRGKRLNDHGWFRIAPGNSSARRQVNSTLRGWLCPPCTLEYTEGMVFPEVE